MRIAPAHREFGMTFPKAKGQKDCLALLSRPIPDVDLVVLSAPHAVPLPSCQIQAHPWVTKGQTFHTLL